MPESASHSAAASPKTVRWNQDRVFAVLGDPVRRRLLLSLARSGAQTGVELKTAASRRLDATLKHLAEMRSAGFVVTAENPKDGRRLLYSLSPSVPVENTPTGTVVDFGFCLLRLSEDWD
jgi:predicted transcriptional regulator